MDQPNPQQPQAQADVAPVPPPPADDTEQTDPQDDQAEDTPNGEATMMAGIVGLDEIIDKGLPPGVDVITISGLQSNNLTVSAAAPGGQPVTVTLSSSEVSRRVAAITGAEPPDDDTAETAPVSPPPVTPTVPTPPKAPPKAPPPGAKA